MSRNVGGSAFSLKAPTTGDDQGISLRDYFAGQALPGVMGMDTGLLKIMARGYGGAVEVAIARSAYEIADAMLAERLK